MSNLRLVFFVAAMGVVGCGGTLADTGDGGDAGDGGGGGDGDGGGADAPADHVQPSGPGMTFAIHDIFLGEGDRNNVPSSTAWKSYGRDVDGLTTIASSTDVCTLTVGSPKAVQADGNAGIDNAWGANIVPILQSAASLPTPSVTISQSIQSGAGTLLLRVVGLTADASQTATGLSAEVFQTGAFQGQGAPAFDTSTSWPVLSTSVKDGQTVASGAIAQFPSASVTGGTFTSGVGTAGIPWAIVFQGVPLPLVIHQAVVSFDHVDASDAVNGMISGVLDTQEFVTALQAVAGQISVSLCGSAFDGIAAQIRQAQDILSDGTNTPNVPCSAISIGLGFSAKLVADPTTVVQAPTLPNPCGN